MISTSNRISRKEGVDELFAQLGRVLEHKIEALLIGGAAMLEQGLKDSTKDIDIVCRTVGDMETMIASASALGFQIIGPQKRHERLGINRLAVKGGHNLDIFANRISYDFGLSESIWHRAIKSRSFGLLEIRDASPEDIFVMKLIANRPGDGRDCAVLFSTVLDFDEVYQEIEAQYRRAGEVEQTIWITYIEEGIGRLEENFNLEMPLGDRVSELADDYRERLYQKLSRSQAGK